MESRTSDVGILACYGGHKGFEATKRYKIKDPPIARLHHLELFMQLRVIDCKVPSSQKHRIDCQVHVNLEMDTGE
jgi:hypothetical protein